MSWESVFRSVEAAVDWGRARQRSVELQRHGAHYVGVGTSGGFAGLERGYCLMIGGCSR